MGRVKLIEYTDDLFLGLDARNVFNYLRHTWANKESIRRSSGLGETRFHLALMDLHRCKIKLQFHRGDIRLHPSQPAVKQCACPKCKTKGKAIAIYLFPHGVSTNHTTTDNKRTVTRTATPDRVKFCLNCCREEGTRTKALSLYGEEF